MQMGRREIAGRAGSIVGCEMNEIVFFMWGSTVTRDCEYI